MLTEHAEQGFSAVKPKPWKFQREKTSAKRLLRKDFCEKTTKKGLPVEWRVLVLLLTLMPVTLQPLLVLVLAYLLPTLF